MQKPFEVSGQSFVEWVYVIGELTNLDTGRHLQHSCWATERDCQDGLWYPRYPPYWIGYWL